LPLEKTNMVRIYDYEPLFTWTYNKAAQLLSLISRIYFFSKYKQRDFEITGRSMEDLKKWQQNLNLKTFT
jgi:hypothetical protein